ncbi:hypothetical protein CAXC1_190006 [Candidatus Xenohaliotis californiensis]|uniref:Ancillary SecYEG translocon subunit/Cell division coordinator CpoB TPR domain-containing protein n=1 Tax=Candidatus Xenohaliotis californiensis TaxID=84677 RepID=A0ABP0EUJ9_9RICK|nr:hypothetical protein CAXC1_190006 [Candidatus Xenohaliotis californiensis]
MDWHEETDNIIEYIWRKYSTIIIFIIVVFGFLSFVGASWYQKKIAQEAADGSLAFKAISSRSSMSLPLREKSLQQLIKSKTNYRQFATLYLGDLYYEQDASNPEVKRLYNVILHDRKANKIVKNFAAQRLAYMALNEGNVDDLPQYISVLKNNNFPLSAKQLQIFYNIAIHNNNEALQLIEELNDVAPAAQEINTGLMEMIEQPEVITPYAP